MIKTEKPIDVLYTFENKHVMFSVDSGIASEEDGVVISFLERSFQVEVTTIKSDRSLFVTNAAVIFTHSEPNSFFTWSSQLISFSDHIMEFKYPKNFFQVDRREYSRTTLKPRTVKTTIYIDEHTIVQGFLKDISYGGIGVELTQGGLVDYKNVVAYFKIELPQSCISGGGVITATFNAGKNVGIRFTEIPDDARIIMDDFILHAKSIEMKTVHPAEISELKKIASEQNLGADVKKLLIDTHEELGKIVRKTVYYLSTENSNDVFNRLSKILNEKYILKKATSIKYDENAVAYLIDVDKIVNYEMVTRNIKTLYQHSPVKLLLVGDMITKEIVIQASKCCVSSIIKLPIESDLAISKILTALEQ